MVIEIAVFEEKVLLEAIDEPLYLDRARTISRKKIYIFLKERLSSSSKKIFLYFCESSFKKTKIFFIFARTTLRRQFLYIFMKTNSSKQFFMFLQRQLQEYFLYIYCSKSYTIFFKKNKSFIFSYFPRQNLFPPKKEKIFYIFPKEKVFSSKRKNLL